MALKLGTENKNKTYAAVGLVLVALIYGAYQIHDLFFYTPTSPPAAVNTPAPARQASPAGEPASSDAAVAPFAHQAIALPSASALDPTLHPEVMAQAEDTTYTGDGRNIFSANSAREGADPESAADTARAAAPAAASQYRPEILRLLRSARRRTREGLPAARRGHLHRGARRCGRPAVQGGQNQPVLCRCGRSGL
jgi:hypothetical protein